MSGNVWLDGVSAGNKYVICQYDDKFASFGHFLTGRNPLSYSVPLLFIQISTIAITSQVIEFCLRPLGQSSIVAHILGGVLYGPSMLGNQPIVEKFLFPPRNIVNLEILASFGIMFFLFAIGVKQDSRMMVRPGKQAAAVGIASMFGTLFCTMTFVVLMKMYIQMDESLSRALPYLAVSQGMSAFPNVACLLSELKMSSTHLGRIANSAAMLCDLLGLTLVAITLGIIQSEDHPVNSAMMIMSTFVFVLTLVFVVGPIIRRIVKTVPPTKTLPGRYVMFCFLGTLMTGLASEVIGQHFLLGPLVFGLLIPDGQPLGEPIISKLDYPVGKLLYPTFLTTSGLKTNFFTIDSQSLWIVVILIFFSCTSKIASVVVTCSLFDIKFRDSVLVGLMMNSRGISELILYNLLRDSAVLSDQEFALSILSVIVVTAVIAPLIRLLYDSSKSFVPLKRRTIQHMKRDAELRIVVCIKNQGNVRTMINILEASNATDHCPIAVIAVVLIELVGRATAMLVAHQPTEALQPTNSTSTQIINALKLKNRLNQFRFLEGGDPKSVPHGPLATHAVDGGEWILIAGKWYAKTLTK